MGSLNPVVLALAIWAIVSLQKSPEVALVRVFPPALLLVPFTFLFHFPHTPSLFCVDAVLLPIGIAAIMKRSHLWKFKRADLWVIIFVVGSGFSDLLNLGLVTALFNFPITLCEVFLAYVAGKLLIEQSGIREQFAKRMVAILSIVTLISVSEFVGKKNLFVILGRRLQSEGYMADQMRGRFLRLKGPFAGPEEAGIVFLVGIFLALWLWYVSRSRRDPTEPKFLGLKRSTIYLLAISLGLYMTISRGPWLGVGAGFLVARIGMVKNKTLALAVALTLFTVGGIYANIKTSQISQLSADDPSLDETTSSAYYRTQLFARYKIIAEQGGLFGWSATGYPRAPGMDSIDNEYIFMWVTQGRVGLWSFIAIAAEGVIAVFLAVRKSRQRIDICFYCCLGAIVVGIMLVVATVYLASQGFVLFFFVAGWIQSLQDQAGEGQALPSGPTSRFTFKRVFA